MSVPHARPSTRRVGMLLLAGLLLALLSVPAATRPAPAQAQGTPLDRDDGRDLARNTGYVGRITEGDVDSFTFSVAANETVSVRFSTLTGGITRWGAMLDRPNDSPYHTVFLVDRWGMFTFEGKYPLWVGSYTLRIFAGNPTSYEQWNSVPHTFQAPLSVLQGPGSGTYAITFTTFEPKDSVSVPALTATAIPGYDLVGGRGPASKIPLRVRFESGGRDVEQACVDTQRIGGQRLEAGDLMFLVRSAGAIGCNPAAERDSFAWPGVLVRNDKPGAASVDFDTITPVALATGENRLAQFPFAMEMEGWGMVPISYEGTTVKLTIPVQIAVKLEGAYRVTPKRAGLETVAGPALNGQPMDLNQSYLGLPDWQLMVPADSVLRVNFLDGSLGLIFFPHPDISYSAVQGLAKTAAQPDPPSGIPWRVESSISSWNADDAGFVSDSGWTGNPIWDDLIGDVLVEAVSQRLSVIKTLWEFFSTDLGGAPGENALVRVRVR